MPIENTKLQNSRGARRSWSHSIGKYSWQYVFVGVINSLNPNRIGSGCESSVIGNRFFNAQGSTTAKFASELALASSTTHWEDA